MSTNGITYCIYNGDTLFVAGKESPLSKTSYKRLQLLMHYPLSYGDSISAPFLVTEYIAVTIPIVSRVLPQSWQMPGEVLCSKVTPYQT